MITHSPYLHRVSLGGCVRIINSRLVDCHGKIIKVLGVKKTSYGWNIPFENNGAGSDVEILVPLES